VDGRRRALDPCRVGVSVVTAATSQAKDPGGSARRAGRRLRTCDEAGFSLVEVIAAVTILVVVIISFSNLLVESLSAALISRQRETAASIASDTIENARALGQSALTAASQASAPTCTVASSTALVLTNPTPITPVPVLPALSNGAQIGFLTPYTTVVDRYTYTVCTTITAPAPTSSADTVSVLVTWGSGKHSYGTSTQVGS
jgi:type II secretory pathway pseudopilin PulG